MSARELIALGGAKGVWQELEQALALFPDADIGAVNDSGADYQGHLSLWCSLHPEKFQKWQRARKHKGLNTDYVAVSPKREAGVDMVRRFMWSGCSGLYLCQIAVIEFGYQQVICCGMPMTNEPHYFDSEGWKAAQNYRTGWKEATQQPQLRNKLKSMSGWTMQLIGSPDKQSVTAS